MVNEEKRIFDGKLYAPGNPELRALKLRSHLLSQEYSTLPEDNSERRNQILKELLGFIGEESFIQGPIFFHYGTHTRIGNRNFFNYNLTIQDDAIVTIGNDNNFGPNLTIVTPCHPMLPDERKCLIGVHGIEGHLCYAKPVTINNDCWFGTNVTICPGVVIGDNCVIGAGSVVTKDIPANSVAVGVPCRVVREISEMDSIKNRPELF